MGTYEGKTVNVVFLTSGNDPYTAGATDDLIQGYGGADTIFGNARDNYIFGDQRQDPPNYDNVDFDPTADGADFLYGFGGDDLLNPGAGTGNFVAGGTGTDTLDYRYATPGQAVTIDMEAGTATAGTYGSTSFIEIENVFGSLNGPNVIYGDANANEITGGDLDDVLFGHEGKDTLNGLRGDDELRGGDGRDHLQGDQGHDTLIGGKGADRLVGGKGNDKITGGTGNDSISGSKGNDRLLGKDGNDRLNGQDGKDVLIAGRGTDKLTGGSGADRFVFNKKSGDNTITDFQSKDVIGIGSGASSIGQLKSTDTAKGLRIEFAKVEIFLKGADIGDLDNGNFDFF